MTLATPKQHTKTAATTAAAKPAHHHRRNRRSRTRFGLPRALKESCLNVLRNEYNRLRENPENVEPLTNNLSRSLVKTFLESVQAYLPWLTRSMFYSYLRRMKNAPPPTTTTSSNSNTKKKVPQRVAKPAKQTKATKTTTGASPKSSGTPPSRMIAELKECCLEFVGKEYNELKAHKPKHPFLEPIDGSIPRDGVKKLLESTNVIFPWITRNVLYNYLRKMKKKNGESDTEPDDDEASNASTTAAIAPPPATAAAKTPPASNNKTRGSRLKGATTHKKHQRQQQWRMMTI